MSSKQSAPATRFTLCALACSLIGSLGSTPSLAQTTPDTKTASSSNVSTLEEIVVTARKKAEKLQEVPLSISAFTSDVLEKAGVTSLQDVANLTPGLSLHAGGGEANLAPTIRGMFNLNSNLNSSGSSDPNVAVFLDGVYIANTSVISFGMVDMERIEVIKGPVSALYGRNAFAGVINYVTKKPSDDLAAKTEVTFGKYGEKAVKASLSGPIQPGVLRAGVAYSYEKNDGSYKDAVNGLRAGAYEKKDAQLSINVTPTDKLTIDGSAYIGDDFFGQPAFSYIDNNCGPLSTSPVSLGQFTQYCGKIVQTHPVEVADLSNAAGGTGNKRRVLSSSLRINYDLGIADVAALLGYNDNTQKRYIDFTGHRNGIPFTLVPGPGTALLPELFGGDDNNSDRSVELRLSSKQDQALRWSTGLYWFNANAFISTLIGIDGRNLPPGQSVAPAPQFLTTNGQFSTSNVTQATNTDRIRSAFLSGEYDILGNLTATAEARRTLEDKSQDNLRNTQFANILRPIGPPISATYEFNNYRASLRYKISKDLMVYGSYGDGTKAGGFNARATIPSEFSFQPETNKTYEVGVKSSFLEDRLQINLAAFSIKSTNLQFSGPSDNPAQTGFVTKNFGGTENKGFELELATTPLQGVTLNAGIGYANPTFETGSYDFANASACLVIPACASRVVTVASPQGPRQAIDLKGLRVPVSSRLTFTSGLQVTRPIQDNLDGFARIDVRYETKQYTAPNNLNYVDSRKVVNLRGGIDNGQWRLTVYVDNLTNNSVPDGAEPTTRLNDFVANLSAYLPAQRTYGVSLGYRY